MLPNTADITFVLRWFSAGLAPSVGLYELWDQPTWVRLGRGTIPLSGTQLFDWLLSIAKLSAGTGILLIPSLPPLLMS